jgi:hypothetical protein
MTSKHPSLKTSIPRLNYGVLMVLRVHDDQSAKRRVRGVITWQREGKPNLQCTRQSSSVRKDRSPGHESSLCQRVGELDAAPTRSLDAAWWHASTETSMEIKGLIIRLWANTDGTDEDTASMLLGWWLHAHCPGPVRCIIIGTHCTWSFSFSRGNDKCVRSLESPNEKRPCNHSTL